MQTTPAWLQNTKIKECFDSLPKSAQTAVIESSNSFNSAEELMSFAENYTGKSPKTD